MSSIIAAIARHAQHNPQAIAIESQQHCFTYPALHHAITSQAQALQKASPDIKTIALLADNGPAWCITDLACLQAGITLIPIPHFFSPSQIAHLIHSTGIDALLTEQPAPPKQATSDKQTTPAETLLDALNITHHAATTLSINATLNIKLIPISTAAQALPEPCAKITFTSGSTGEPKGVCLSSHSMETVSASLAQVIEANANDRHLSLLPYATLLENIGGIYAPLLSGATIIAASLGEVGLSGSSGLDIQRFVGILLQSRPTSCIMIPQMLHALVAALETGLPKPSTLRFIAVGGAPASHQLLQRAQALDLPIFEGYGLSEASSVVAVNSPLACKKGSVGKVLPHAKVKCNNDGEILVSGGLFSGYLGEAALDETYYPTGDIGYIDDEGFLFLSGRKKHIFITAFGRNVSPEWVERELTMEPAIAQCCVFGEARPFNVAIIVAHTQKNNGENNSPTDQASSQHAIKHAIEHANIQLPDYASISDWILADTAFTVENGLWTGTGRPRRTFIFNQFKQQIEQLYSQQ